MESTAQLDAVGHASLKNLEEYVELDELLHNHPLKDIL